jgi:hypothetical protein
MLASIVNISARERLHSTIAASEIQVGIPNASTLLLEEMIDNIPGGSINL